MGSIPGYDEERRQWNEAADLVMSAYGDEEIGHGMEDSLLEEFVRAVRDGRLVDPAGIADLLVDKILTQSRTRWYA